MRLQISKSKNAKSYYIVKSVRINGLRTSKIVEKLGTEEELLKKLNGQDPVEWGKAYAAELTRLEKEGREPIVIAKYTPNEILAKNKQNQVSGGYLFLQDIYYKLGIDKICNEITKTHKFEYDLNGILSNLIYSRILSPSSKLSSFELCKKYIEKPNYELHHIYRALEVISSNSDFIQSQVYKNSMKLSKRNTGVLFYDCTNYFFELEEASGIKQYGRSKENRPNPIVQMGLFMDGDGIPLAFSIFKGNMNEQLSLKPLEQQIIKDFDLSKFVVCTDAGLSSQANRRFNNINNRAFITTQSIKKLKSYLKEWALDPKGWTTSNNDKLYDISTLNEFEHKNTVFFKERWINENGLEQKLIITYSIKHKNYQRYIRESQIARAQKIIDKNPNKLKKINANDSKRFIKTTNITKDGEIAENTMLELDMKVIKKEEKFDGFYAVCTNLEDDASSIAKINKQRWEIEECFRIMKTEFKARPIYLSKEDRIEAHFMTCFLALIIFRILEKKLDYKYTCPKILSELKEMNFLINEGNGYIPCYERTDFTDDLHEKFEFRTDYKIVTTKKMKEILKATKNK